MWAVGDQGFEADRAVYLRHVVAGLDAYLDASGGVRIESSRHSDELTITFTLTDGGYYQKLLTHFTGSDRPSPARADTQCRVARPALPRSLPSFPSLRNSFHGFAGQLRRRTSATRSRYPRCTSLP